MKSSYILIKKWVLKNKLEAFLLFGILALSAHFRLFRIGDYMTFLGDEGRDAIVVRRLLVNFDPILVGPGTSIGNMYLGPLYYYLMAPFLFLFNYSPVGPAIMVAFLGVVTVYLVWHTSRVWFGSLSAFVAALLFATAPVVITYSRSSWNPNIMPFFSLLSVYAIWKVYKDLNYKWLLVLGFSLAFVLNSHYLGLLLLPTIGIFWIITFLKNHHTRSTGHQTQKRKFITHSTMGFLVFAILMSPLVIFDARHDWRNFEAIKTFFTVRQETVSVKPWTAIPKIYSIWEKITTRLITATDSRFASFFSGFSALFVFAFLLGNFKKLKGVLKDKFPADSSAFLLLTTWILVGLFGFGVYKQEIYDHYYGFIYPAIFILLGSIVGLFYKNNKFVGGFLGLIFVPILFIQNLTNSPLKYPPNNQLKRSMEVASRLNELSDGKEFNFAVIAERNYEGAYQYFLERDNAQFVIIDAQRADETIKDQLFVVCELPTDKCDPTHNAKTEIANFGWSEVEYQEDYSGVTIFKLIHYTK